MPAVPSSCCTVPMPAWCANAPTRFWHPPSTIPTIRFRWCGWTVTNYRPNRRGTSYYTQVICGPVVLTQSYVDAPEAIVRRAEFRRTLARSNYRSLFGDDPPPPPDSPLLDPEIADRCRVFHHFASGAQITRLSVDPDKGMAGRCVQGLIDVLEGNYGGDVTKMPYVVNKEAFTP